MAGFTAIALVYFGCDTGAAGSLLSPPGLVMGQVREKPLGSGRGGSGLYGLEIQTATKWNACLSHFSSVGVFLFTESLRLEKTSEMESISCVLVSWVHSLLVCLLTPKVVTMGQIRKEISRSGSGKGSKVRGCWTDCREWSRVASTASIWVTQKVIRAPAVPKICFRDGLDLQLLR